MKKNDTIDNLNKMGLKLDIVDLLISTLKREGESLQTLFSDLHSLLISLESLIDRLEIIAKIDNKEQKRLETMRQFHVQL